MRKIVRDRIFKRDKYKCQFCGSKDNLVVDHIIPLSRGGLENESNMQTLCKKCNSHKYNRIPFENYIKITPEGDILISESYLLNSDSLIDLLNYSVKLMNNYQEAYPYYKAIGNEKIILNIR